MDVFAVDSAALLKAAEGTLRNSYSVYSSFPVGAACLSDDGAVFTGTNVENASFGLSICAERAAIFNMVSAVGFRTVRAIAVVSGKRNPVIPCGACLQVMSEFAPPTALVITQRGDGEVITWTLGDLLPQAFNLGK